MKNFKYCSNVIRLISLPIICIYALYSIFFEDVYTNHLYNISRTIIIPIAFGLMFIHGCIEILILKNKNIDKFFWIILPIIVLILKFCSM